MRFIKWIGVLCALCLAVSATGTAEPVLDESQFLGNTRQLTYSGKRAGEGYFSENGTALIFQSEREPDNPFYQIYLMDLKSGDTHRVSTGVGKTTCAFFRPGTDEVLYASTHHDRFATAKQAEELEFRASGKERRYSWDYDEAMDIFSAHRDGSNLRQLTDAPGYDAEASYSPDGTRIVFCSLRDAYPKSKLAPQELKLLEMDAAYFGEIYIMNADGSNQQRLTDRPGYDGGPFFTPDGQHIVWRHFTPDGSKADIYTMRTDGSRVKRLTDFDSMSWAPYFHPSGAYVIFASNKFGFSNFELFLVDAAGRHEPVRVTHTDGFDGLPVFSPDGNTLCWTSNRNSQDVSQLYLAEWNHQAAIAAIAAAPESRRARVSDGDDTAQDKASPYGLKNDTEISIRKHIEFLADDALEGRMTGSEGAKQAADYIAERFAQLGLKPVGESSGSAAYFQEFEFTAGRKLIPNENRFWLTRQTGDARLESAPTVGGDDARLKSAPTVGGDDARLESAPTAGGDDARLESAPTEDGDDARLESAPTGDEQAAVPNAHAGHGQKSAETLEFGVETDFMPLSFSRNGVVEGEVVFVGYGLTVPGEMGVGYDSYAGIDVTDKIVVALRYVPEAVEPERRQQLNRYAGHRYKAMQARERGAKAFLVVAGPNSPNAGKLIPLDVDNSLADSGIIAASISDTVANALFAPSGKQLKAVQSGLDVENPHFVGQFALPDVTIKITVSIEKVKKTARNVIGLLPPENSSPDAEYIVIGAHYDGLGYGETGSLARKDEEGQIHNGADDNASGTAVVLELAARLSKMPEAHPVGGSSGPDIERHSGPEPIKRGLLFALWSGEEIGIIGSSYFVENPVVPLEQLVAYLNFDMVGRLQNNSLILQGVGSSSAWPALIERQNVPVGFNLTLQTDPYLPTDVTAFYPKKVPVLNFFTGGHEDYHRPTDDVETLNYEGMARVVALGNGLVLEMATAAERPEYVEVERHQTGGGSRDTLRAYLGTIPDYSTDIAGVKLSGVRAGGPADKAGLKGGDVIVEFGGQQIANIYDYTFALDAVKIGEPVEVVVLRVGKRVTLTVIPEARN